MARIPIIEIPKGVPVGSGEMPLLHAPVPDLYKSPSIEANLPQINLRADIPFAQQGFDIERHIPGLMQGQISDQATSDIIEGMQAQGRVAGQAAMGIGSALTTVSGAVSSLTRGLQQSKDQADLSRATMTMQMGHAAFEQEVAINQVPTSQKQALWESKYQPKIEADLNALKMSPYTADRVLPEYELFKIKTRTGIIDEARKEQIRNDEQAILNDLQDAVEKGDGLRAVEANDRLTRGRHQSHSQAAKRGKDIQEALIEHTVATDLNKNPRMVLQEMEEAERDGKSDIYPSLTNPATIAKYKREARNEVNRREVDTDQSISDKILAGEIKSEEDIRRAAGGNLSETRIKARAKMLVTDPAYDAQAVSTLRTEVQAYDAQGDFDMAKYHALREKISTTVPKDIQGRLNAELYQTATEARDGKFKTPQQKFAGEVMQQIDHLAKMGLFDPPGYDREDAKKDPLRYREQEQEIWTKVETHKEMMREWLKKNPDATPEQAARQLNELVGRDVADGAGKVFAPKPPAGLRDILPPAAARQQEERRIDTEEEPISFSWQDPKTGEWMDLTPEEARKRGVPIPKTLGEDSASRGTSSTLREPFVDRVKELEGFEPTAKWDSGQYSVGHGTRGQKGESLTPEEADARLREELSTHAANVDRAAKAAGMTLTPGQRDALISFDFNTGAAEFLISSSNGNISEIRRRMPSWNKEYKGGPTSRGLVNRRKAELEMFDA